MKITGKQLHVLSNLHRIVMRPVGRRLAPFLDGEACGSQLNSLAAKKLIALDNRGKATKLGDPSGITDTRWSHGVIYAALRLPPDLAAG